MSATAVFTFLGGIGLFLLGMKLMTDGLTAAAGDTLRSILAAATHSRFKALASGVLITAIVQSSSAVIFTTIGFVNAGLLSLVQSVGIIYGANLGTTLTSWIVALLGFNLDLQALAMPMIGIGMALSVGFGDRRQGALGRAMAGFGIFFLGIAALRGAFEGLGDVIALESWAGQGILSLVLFVGIGIVMTLVVQSSSAALAVILTATAGGLIPLTAAAAMVIGANVGTTSTGVFAAIGATAPAKRAASAHVIFNLVTGVVAFTLLIPLLWLVERIALVLGSENALATSLAIFHTLVKLLGILIMAPVTELMVRLLEKRFRSLDEDASQPHFLDRNVQSAPSLATGALVLELHRMNAFATRLASEAISTEDSHNPHLESGYRALDNLNVAVGEFASGIPRNGIAAGILNALPDAQRVGQYLVNVAEHAVAMVKDHPATDLPVARLADARNQLRAHAVALLSLTQVDARSWNADVLTEARRTFEAEYQSLKSQLLHAGTAGDLAPRRMALALERLSELHRIVDQSTKAAIYLDRFITQSHALHAAGESAVAVAPGTDSGANLAGTPIVPASALQAGQGVAAATAGQTEFATGVAPDKAGFAAGLVEDMPSEENSADSLPSNLEAVSEVEAVCGLGSEVVVENDVEDGPEDDPEKDGIERTEKADSSSSTRIVTGENRAQ